MTASATALKQSVKEYYGEVLKTKDDLKTSACCPLDAMPLHLRPYLSKIHAEVQESCAQVREFTASARRAAPQWSSTPCRSRTASAWASKA